MPNDIHVPYVQVHVSCLSFIYLCRAPMPFLMGIHSSYMDVSLCLDSFVYTSLEPGNKAMFTVGNERTEVQNSHRHSLILTDRQRRKQQLAPYLNPSFSAKKQPWLLGKPRRLAVSLPASYPFGAIWLPAAASLLAV